MFFCGCSVLFYANENGVNALWQSVVSIMIIVVFVIPSVYLSLLRLIVVQQPNEIIFNEILFEVSCNEQDI
jgi:hypothetical protein